MRNLSTWHQLVRHIVIPAGLFVVFVAGTVFAADPAMTPQSTIQKVTDDVLALLQANRDKLRKNPVEVATLVARVVNPYFDYHLMSEEALGMAWRRATAQQRLRFTKAFHALLVNDYAAAFKQYTNQTIKLTGMRWNNAAHSRATVLTKIYSPGEQPVKIDYYLHASQGRWKVYDVMIDGISLLINYRETFTDELRHENLDTLISNLQQKVASDKRSAPK